MWKWSQLSRSCMSAAVNCR